MNERIPGCRLTNRRFTGLWSNDVVITPAGTPLSDAAVERLRADYDLAPYDSNAFPQSAPGQLAVVAHLFGLDPPDVATARVLELGCAAGGNIIPFAAAHPDATVVGVDLSQVQIDDGRRLVEALGITNLELVAADIASMDLAGLGQFDYIVAHGVFSWVPPNVQEAIFKTFRTLLVPDGIAYMSYNTYPGWKSKEIVRDAMLLSTNGSETPQDKVREARGMVSFLEQVARPDSFLARAVAEFRSRDEKFDDSYLLHDELEAFNAPCYFLEVVERAGAHGLSFLAEARPEAMFPGNYQPGVAERLAEKCGGVQVLVEQHLDFVVDRAFRETLLIHADQASQIRYVLDRNRYGDMHFAASLPPVDEETRLDSSQQGYLSPSGATLYTDDPAIKAAFDALSARAPWTLSRAELTDTVTTRLRSAGLEPGDGLADQIDHVLDVLVLQGQARCRLEPVLPDIAASPPVLDAAVRKMVEATRPTGDPSTFTLWHQTVSLSPLDSHLLPMLDGTRDRVALVDALVEIAVTKVVNIELDGDRVTDESVLREVFGEYVDALPERLEEMKLVRAG